MIEKLDRPNHKSQTTNHKSPRIALKVDCDTYVGTREGVPRLLEILGERGIRATFFFTFGPDRSGVAVRRFLTTPGFARKMLKSRAASLYGFPTVLYGTLLPAPRIGERCRRQIRSVAEAGHDAGVHAWDHVGWHDRLDSWSEPKIREQSGLAHTAYESIFERPARAAASAGWTVNALSLAVEAERNLSYTSNTRLGTPFFPRAGGQTLQTLEIPTTLPTLDETLTWPELPDEEAQRRFFREAPRGTEVHTIHTEVEGRSKSALFARILDDWASAGVTFLTLEELARQTFARGEIPARELTRTTLRGRGGTVATGWPPGGAA
ncbi:MAG TPA: polysaccharide deacetylase family protein [Thermoanaerobaculia bacterium]|nr:polysaccharide deacetylase family protein [Thermoanaerobaculia bacterium]